MLGRYVALAVMAIVMAACSGSTEPKVPRPRVVETFTISEGSADITRTFIGELRAAGRAELSFEIGGVVTELNVDLGNDFSRGQVLGRLEARSVELDLEARAAELRNAKANLVEAKLHHKRHANLAGTGAVSEAAIDAASARLKSAEAMVAALHAQVNRAKETVRDTWLIAPFNGQIAARLAEPSQVVQAGQPIFRVTSAEAGMEAVVQVPERLLDSFRLGQRTELVLKPSNLEAAAIVSELGRSANGSGLFPVTLSIEEGPEARLKPGVRIEVTKAVGVDAATIRVPPPAVLAGQGGAAFVMLIDSETSQLIQREIEVGPVRGNRVAVLSGLEPGDMIVAKGVGLLKEGELVAPSEIGVARFNQ